MRTKTYYHGTDTDSFDPRGVNPEIGRFDLCLALEEEVAESYADDERSGDHGDKVVFVITVDHSEVSLADEEEATEIVKELYGIDSLGMWLFEYLDCEEVITSVLDSGFDGVEFVDQSPIDYKEHDTVRLYRPDSIVSCERI